MNTSVSTIVRCLAVVVGIATTLLTASLLKSRDPELVAAEEKFSDLSPEVAHRVQVTFDLLEESRERRHIEVVHATVSEDVTLSQQLTDFGKWWDTLSESEQDAIRELPEDRWAAEVHAQMQRPDTDHETVLFQIPGFLQDRNRRDRLRVDIGAIDSFLQDAIPVDDLSDGDTRLLEAVSADDLRLARSLVITGRLFSIGDRDRPGNRGNRKEIERVFGLVNDRLPGDFRDNLSEQVKAVACLGVLWNIIKHEQPGFRERYSQTQDLIEQEFAELPLADRKKVMLSDPIEAERSLQVRLLDSGRRSPENQLAARLAEHLEARKKFQSRFRPPPAGRGGRQRPRPERRD